LKSDQIILDAIVSHDGNFDRILRCLEVDPVKLNVDLMRLEIEGLVKKDIAGKYYRF
jgi:predicted Rossmann fold nucleotide-binding protein DprA/Smf involved in DNA uptake